MSKSSVLVLSGIDHCRFACIWTMPLKINQAGDARPIKSLGKELMRLGCRNEATKSCPSRIPSLQIYVNRCYINHQYFVATLLFKHEIIRFSRPMLNEFPEMCSNAFLLSLSHICIFMPQFITLLVRLDYVF